MVYLRRTISLSYPFIIYYLSLYPYPLPYLFLASGLQSLNMSNPNFYYNKPDHQENAKQVKAFYLAVLEEFESRLQKQSRHKERLMDAQQIQKLKQLVKYKLDFPVVLFEKYLSMKEAASRNDFQIKNQIEAHKQAEVKEEYDEANNDYRIGSELRIKDKDSDSDQDDLEDYEQALNTEGSNYKAIGVISFRPSKSEVEVKREEGFEPYARKVESEKEIKEEERESEESEEELGMEECLSNLNSIILSTFCTPTLKHKPKEEKITVNLDNTFLKSVYGEFYLGAVQVDINKIEKSDVKEGVIPSKVKNGR